MDIPAVTLFLILALAFANGANDVSKAIATLVGGGITDYRTAILWGGLWTTVGAGASAFLTGAMIRTFSHGLIQPGVIVPPTIALAVLLGSIAWVLIASRTGLPVSTTHALTGSIVGTGLTAFGGEGLVWSAIGQKIVLPLLLSPLLAFTASFVLHSLVRLLAARWEGACLCVMPASRALVAIDAHGGTRTLFQSPRFGQPVMAVPAQCDRVGLQGLVVGLDTIHWISSGLTSFARGTNDAPKIVAMLLLGSTVTTWPSATMQVLAYTGVAVAMALGSYLGGTRVTEMLATKVTRMNHVEGLSANLTTSSLVLLSGTLGLPVSTTHVSSSAIIGIGLLKGLACVRWTTVRDMLLAWIVTLPVSALLSMLAFLLLHRMSGA